jgi:Fuc2NAc and GlcNAc transferase
VTHSDNVLRLIGVAVAAGLCSAVCCAIVRRIAATVGLVDVPNERSSHLVPTPRGGGIGIVVGTVGAVLLMPLAGLMVSSALASTIVIGGGLVAAVSLIDDLRTLSVYVRLAAHFMAAAIAVVWIGPVSLTSPTGAGALAAPLDAMISTVWIVGLVNAYNFMDGIDGLTAGQAAMASAGLVAVGVDLSQFSLVALGAIVGSTSAGFLVQNWSPARLFLGDVGSVFLGYVIAVLTLAAAHEDPMIGLIAAALSWPFLFDTSWTLLRRLRHRENVFEAHRSHLYQRLIATGLGHRVVAAFYLLLTAVAIGAAVAALRFPASAPWILLSYAVSSAAVLIAVVRRHEASSIAARRWKWQASRTE